MKKALAIASSLVLAIGLSGCSTESEQGISNTDRMFLEMMIPHHEQAIEMAHFAEKNSTNREILALAKTIDEEQHGEVELMSSWVGESHGKEHAHGGDDMMGMLSEEQMQEMKKTSGSEFDRLFLEGMILHHEGAIDMAQMVLASKNPDVRKLGESIVKSQTDQIAQMRKLLESLQ